MPTTTPLADLTVADRMTETVFSLLPGDSLEDALDLMLAHDVRHVPVVDDEGVVVGVVSHRDLLAEDSVETRVDDDGSLVALHRVLPDKRIDQVMNRPETATPETRLAEAGRILLDYGYGCLPVVDNRRLIGILTESDFVRLVVEAAED